MKNNFIYRLSFLLISLVSCIDPVTPEFKFKEGLVYIEAFAATSEGNSFVKISESAINRNRTSNVFIEGAEVFFINTNTGVVIQLIEEKEVYIPPANFVISVGESWELEVKLTDGRHYKSLPETVLEPVAISKINATYNPELLFKESLDSYVPGHSISVSLEDPSGGENYYYWSFRSFESLSVCETCFDGFFRNGACESFPNNVRHRPFYTYNCDSECWRIRFNENIKVFSDEFTNGSTINQLPIADVLLFTKENILVEVQQFSLSVSAYEYYKTLKDIIDNNGGFNAPPPAALIGNLFNANNSEEYVLGRFTAASTSSASVFINRTNINEAPLERIETQAETSPPIPELDLTYTAPCVESRIRTSIRPQGWIN